MINYKFPTYKFISNVECFVTIIHGTDDSIIPIESAKKLFDASPKERTNFITIKAGNHNNLIDFEAYHVTISKLLK